jgi:hypothetical protein
MENQKYSARKTVVKGAVPLAVIALAWLLRLGAGRLGVDLTTENSYEVALLGYGAAVALVNWVKNRNKGKPGAL